MFNSEKVFNKQQMKGLAELLSIPKQPHSQPSRQYPKSAISCEEMYARANNNIAEIAFQQRKDKPYIIMPYIHKTDFIRVMEIIKENWNNLSSRSNYEELQSKFEISFKNQTSMNKPKKSNIIRVIKDKNLSVVGFITYLLHQKKQQISRKGFGLSSTPRRSAMDTHINVGYIELVAIDKNNHRSGLGTLLLQQAIDDLSSKGSKTIDLHVLNTNFAAINCYMKLDFTLNLIDDKVSNFIKTIEK